MANQALSWIKEHPGTAALGVGGLLVVFYLLTRSSSGSSSAASSYYGAQADLASQQAQYGAIEAQQQSQVQETQIAADTQNYQTLASLAAVKEQYDAAVQAAQINAGVVNNQTAAAESVANTQTTTEGNVAGEYLNAETSALQSELTAQTTQQENTQNFLTNFASYVTDFNGSQNRLSFLQSVLGQPSAAAATEAAYAGINNPQYGLGYQVGTSSSGITSILNSLFG